jgi:hypothetical protein
VGDEVLVELGSRHAPADKGPGCLPVPPSIVLPVAPTIE